jgi:hypothetical protein
VMAISPWIKAIISFSSSVSIRGYKNLNKKKSRLFLWNGFGVTRNIRTQKKCRSHLKKVFFPNLCVRLSFQVLDILEYACGLKLGPALTLRKNLIFEMALNFIFTMKFYLLFCKTMDKNLSGLTR